MKSTGFEGRKMWKSFLVASLFAFLSTCLFGQDLARYQPKWVRNGFADDGTTHEPWIFLVRRNSPSFNLWWEDQFKYRLSEEYIKSLADAGVTVYHIFCYKGFGFEAEKESMRQTARAAAIAHKYGMKVDTYVQWNNLFYETFFREVPQAETDQWYKVDEVGKPIILSYGYAPYRRQICFNNEDFLNYYKEKILRFVVDSVKTDFIHFDNFGDCSPRNPEYNKPTIAAFRNYLRDKYTPEKRMERFGFSDVSHILPPIWNNNKNQEYDSLKILVDPVMQEWCDFRCWSVTGHLADMARFVRSLNKEVVIEVNAAEMTNRSKWEGGINHGDLMQYTNVIWAEGHHEVQWENGHISGKFPTYKLGRITHNYILCYNKTAQGNAEKLAYNRCPAWLGLGLPTGVTRQYLDFWHAHRDLYTNVSGGERVAILYSYPSMAYNLMLTDPDQAGQILQQHQIAYDIVFDQQLDSIKKYDVLILANQETLADSVIEKINRYVKLGGGLVVTGRTGAFDSWRRIRKPYGLSEIFGDVPMIEDAYDWKYHYPDPLFPEEKMVSYGKGRAVYLPNMADTTKLEEAILQAAGKVLPLTVKAPEWVGISHDLQAKRDIIHLVNYRKDQPVDDISLELTSRVKKAWMVSPDFEGRKTLIVNELGKKSKVMIPSLQVYDVVVLEK